MVSARLLIDPPLPGPVNMARDEALLEGCTNPAAEPTVRFYAWSPATISLGYFQEWEEYLRLPPPAGGLPVVRRTTGGGAILHDLEVTYSIVIPVGHPLVAGRPNNLYTLAHEAIIAAIGGSVRLLGGDEAACGQSSQRGPFFCFARRHGLDVVVANGGGPGGYSKIAGSAQRRTAAAILQHGSIMLDSRYPQQPLATWSAVAGGRVGFAEAVERLTTTFAARLEADLIRDGWQDAELDAAGRWEERYTGEAWTRKRERHHGGR